MNSDVGIQVGEPAVELALPEGLVRVAHQVDVRLGQPLVLQVDIQLRHRNVQYAAA